MAQGPFLWPGAHLANESLQRGPVWPLEGRSSLPGRQHQKEVGLGHRGAHLQGYFCAPRSAGLLVYKNQRAEAEALVQSPSY